MLAGGWKVPKKVTVLIRENGQPIQTKERQEQDNTNEETIGRHEHAASQQSSKQTSQLELIQDNYQKSKKAKYIFRLLKPFVLTILTAMIVGSVLGFIMLRMFGGIGAETGDEQVDPVSGFQSANANDSEEGTQSFTLDSIDLFMMQGGVFTEESNAREWKSTFQDSGLPAMLWKRDGQIYLFVGFAMTKETGENLAEQYPNLDIYVREWSVPSVELEGTEEEKEWLEAFLAQWQTSAEQLESTERFQLGEWDQLYEQAPDNSEKLAPVVTAIESMEQDGDLEGKGELIGILYEYEQMIK